MRSIAVDVTQGLIYEGNDNLGRGVLPTPTLLVATDFSKEIEPESIPDSEDLGTARLVFREDTFDAITRLRRGRFYVRGDDPRPQRWHVKTHPAAFEAHQGFSGHSVCFLHAFNAWPARQLMKTGARPSVVSLGTRSAYTLWRVVDIERVVTGEDLVTLRARSTLGLLPELRESAVPIDAMPKIVEVLETLTGAAHTSAPSSVIDRARDAAQWCIGVWWSEREQDSKQRHRDLAEISKAVEGESLIVAAIGRTIARLHARGKPNEQERRALRPPMEADAEYALAAVGLLLREIGWAA